MLRTIFGGIAGLVMIVGIHGAIMGSPGVIRPAGDVGFPGSTPEYGHELAEVWYASESC